jgi:hypothetical protein
MKQEGTKTFLFFFFIVIYFSVFLVDMIGAHARINPVIPSINSPKQCVYIDGAALRKILFCVTPRACRPDQ